MAVTPLPIETPCPEKSFGMRRISSNLRFKSVPASPSTVTVDRRGPVGEPTIGSFQALGDRDDDIVVAMPHTAASDVSPRPSPALVREAIATALEGLDAVEAQAYDAARRFRRLAVGEAHERLSHLVESAQTLLTLAMVTADAAGTDLDAVCTEHELTVERDTQTALALMIARQLDGDWPGLARAIEQPFVAALHGWRTVFQLIEDALGPWGHAA